MYSEAYQDRVILENRIVDNISGNFIVPSYQRGYRWGEIEVERLLDDIENSNGNNYCLQPIVVKKKGEEFELVDGQQRLTTLYLLYQFMHCASNGFIKKPKFTFRYETREKSREYLESLDEERKNENIDFYFINKAHETIKNWFAQRNEVKAIKDITRYFENSIKVIWYQVGENEDAVAMFTRLNVGKIPLTSAELVKAMLLSKDNGSGISRQKQEEIALLWHEIEKELHNKSLWYFLTNQQQSAYQTRIDLILDLVVGKQDAERDRYATFFRFDRLLKEKNPLEAWNEIQRTFLMLKEWHDPHELYHHVGYLIASGFCSLLEIYEEAKGKTKDAFREYLHRKMKDSIDSEADYGEMSYENNAHYADISRLLLLFNVVSVRDNGEQSQWFPFDKFKFSGENKVSWSLEHIHAQLAEGLKRQEDWREWLELHLESIHGFADETSQELHRRMKAALEKEPLKRGEFDELQREVAQRLSTHGDADYLHSISNLALLNTSDNAALNNSAFDVKRNAIIKMDKNGQYIPFCTRMVFLKYYTPSEKNQLHFWAQPDRIAYVQAMNETLADYLKAPITFERED